MNFEYTCRFESFKIVYNNNTLEAVLYEDGKFIEKFSINFPIYEKIKFTLEEVLKFLTPTVDIFPFTISKNFTHKDDPFHWQQPCCTEMKAYELHTDIPQGSNVNKKNKTIDTYLGIPWASFIDKKFNLGQITLALNAKIERAKRLAKSIGYTLNVHTVCQSIHWQKYLDYFYQIGVTDLHASHYSDVLTKKENPYNIRMHSWHLYAVNVEDVDRNENIEIDRPVEEKNLLASFKGAHMPHYLSDVRLLLFPALQKDKIKEDISIEVTDEWHFNKHVFFQQVKGIDISNNLNNKDIPLYNSLISRSIFTLCPEGAGINTIRFWEALAVGSIPVLMISDTHIPMLYRLHSDLHKCCILVFRDQVINVFKLLRSFSIDEIKLRQNLCREVYLAIKNQTTFQNQYNTLFGLY